MRGSRSIWLIRFLYIFWNCICSWLESPFSKNQIVSPVSNSKTTNFSNKYLWWFLFQLVKLVEEISERNWWKHLMNCLHKYIDIFFLLPAICCLCETSGLEKSLCNMLRLPSTATDAIIFNVVIWSIWKKILLQMWT